MKLHEAIAQVLKEAGRSMSTSELAAVLNRNKLYEKKDKTQITAFQIHGRTKNYPEWFDRNGSMVALKTQIIGSAQEATDQKIRRPATQKGTKDESYILDLCDETLQHKSIRQHTFDFLKGDTGVKLPVDGYYPELELVIEYHEIQHTGSVKLFDKRVTASGVTRDVQRRKYDELRKKLIPENGLKLIILDYSEFECKKNGRLLRSEDKDKDVIIGKLSSFL